MPVLAAGLLAPASLHHSACSKPLPTSRPGAAQRRQRPCVAAPAARARGTGRGTWEAAPPARSPRLRHARGRQPPRGGQQREPFDAELLVLFGIPLLVLGIAYAFNDPKSLAVALPLALLIPGPRDVLLHVAADVMRAAVRARRFVSVDSDADEAAAAADAAARTHRERQRRRAAAARPPPPPPPPPPAVEVELHPGEYAVYPPPAPSPLSAQDTPQPPPPPPPRRQHAAPRAPLPEVQPAATRQRGEAFAGASRGWPPVVDVSATTSQPPQQQSGHGASHGWPAASPAASSQRRRSRSRGGSLGARTAAVASAPQGSPGAMGRQRRPRSRLSQPAGKAGVSGQGWGGSDGAATPLLLRPIFALIPFLRYWGGFL